MTTKTSKSSRARLAAKLAIGGALWAAALIAGCGGGDDSTITQTPPVQDSGGGSTIDVTVAPPTDASTCSLTTCNGACVDPSSDPANCGTCGTACTGGQVCSKGACALSCGGGTTMCGATCNDTQSDPKNCGACGTACTAGQVCSMGMCALTCGGGTTMCGAACVDTHVDGSNCGACGTQCGAGAVCSNGTCQSTCTGGLATCRTGGEGGDGGTGAPYCAATSSDQRNCGACGTICAAGTACSGGTCQTDCGAGRVNCNGTCVNPLTDRQYCGATLACGSGDAGDAGGTAGAQCGAGSICNNGVCTVSCPVGEISCGGSCVDPTSNRSYCGASGTCGAGDASADAGTAGTVCGAGLVCSASKCVNTCAAPQIVCGGNCVDPTSNRSYCGASGGCGAGGDGGGSAGAVCPAGAVCANSACTISCPVGEINCGGSCIDPLSNRSFCGATGACGSDASADAGTPGASCGAGLVCSAGACVLSCKAPQILCGGNCVDPTSNRTYCGASGGCGGGGDGGGSAGTTCTAGQICSSSACTFSCEPGETLCGDSGLACTNLQNDPNNCGVCGTICAGGNSCVSGMCQAVTVVFPQASYAATQTFTDALGGTTMQLTFDGTSYWSASGGSNSGVREARYTNVGVQNGTYSPGIDFRTIFSFNGSGLAVYARGYASNTFAPQTAPGVYGTAITLTGGSLDAQATLEFNSAGNEIWGTQSGGIIARWTTGGVYIGTITLTGFGTLNGENTYPQGSRFAIAGGYILTYSGGVLSAWNASGARVKTTILTGAGTSFDSYFAPSYANGKVWIVDVAGGTWRGYNVGL